MQWPTVFVIILNWNGWKDTIECLESLYSISYPNYRVVVVDNNSVDDSLVRIEEYARGEISVESSFFPQSIRQKSLRVTEYVREEAENVSDLIEEATGNYACQAANEQLVIIKNEQNFGYAEGNNIGMRYAMKAAADYILLLNNDTVVHEDFLSELVNAAERDKCIGVIGPKVYWYAAPDRIQCTGAHFDFRTGRVIELNWCKTDNDLDFRPKNGLLHVDYVPGTCLLVRRKVIERVGGLDPIYFLYFEETDWCFRIRRAGYKIVCDQNAVIWHKGMASSSATPFLAQYYLARNRVIFVRKYGETSQLLSFLAFFPLYHAMWLLKKSRVPEIPCFVKGFIDGLLIDKGASR